MQHLDRHINPVREAVQALYLEVPREIADDVKARVDKLIDRIEAYQSAVDLLLTAIVQEGIRPDYTPEFKALMDSANLLRRQPSGTSTQPFNGPGPTIPGFYWCIHKESGKMVVGELSRETTGGLAFHYPYANSVRNENFKNYFWIGPLRPQSKPITSTPAAAAT